MNRATILMTGALAQAVLLLQPLCATAQAPAPDRVQKLVLRVGEHDRTYSLYVPATVKPGQPLVIALHGTFGNGEAMRHDTDFAFEKLANQHGFVVAYPDAVQTAWNDCRTKNLTFARAQKVDDVSFLRDVIRTAVAHYGSDPARVFLFGFSGGAHMAYRMAWEAPEDVAAVAAVGGNLPPADGVSCRSSGKTPRMLMIKGKSDSGDPFEGGPHGISGSVISAHASAATFATQNGLADPPSQADLSPTVKFTAWPPNGRALVGLYALEGIGHMVPVGWRDKVDGPALAWKFFTAP